MFAEFMCACGAWRAAALGLAVGVAASGACAQTFGSALSFDGQNDQVRSDFNFDTAQLTVEAWVFVRSFAPIGYGGLAAWGRNQDAAWETSLGVDGALSLQLNWNKAGHRVTHTPGVFALNRWTHVAVTYDGAVARVYSNAQLVNTVTLGVAISSGGAGAWMALNNQFPGGDEFVNATFDEVRIWSTARSQYDLFCSMNRRLDGNEPGLLAYYDFDEASGQAVVDRSPAHRDAFLGSSASADSADPARIASEAPYQCLTLMSGVPTDILTCPSGEVDFVARACGVGNVAFQWQWRAAIQPEWANVDEGPNVPGDRVIFSGGATNTTALNVRPPLGGLYDPADFIDFQVRCVISNECDMQTTREARLRVCEANFNCDGAVDSQDFFDFITAFFSLELRSDFNRDGFVNSQDLFDFLVSFFAGC